MNFDQPAISVSDLNHQIKELLEGSFPQLWVEGEISNFIYHSSGHMYFTLKDDESEIRAVMFKGNNQFLHFKPENGMRVFLNGRVSVYEPRGQYQLIAQRMEPAGLGTLFLAFEALKKQLSSEGLFDDDAKKPLPGIPKKIGIITSKTGAAIKDMMQVLERRAPYVELILRPTLVQGDDAAEDIVDAIREVSSDSSIDLIILGRGGGSLEDLWPFNEEKVARAIFDCTTPIISAVGHETDVTISDMVADLRAPTPSAAAELTAPSISELLSRVDRLNERLSGKLMRIMETQWQKMDHLQDRFTLQRPDAIIQRLHEHTYHLVSSFTQSMAFKIQKAKGRMDSLTSELKVLDPMNVLHRGYAIATSFSGKVLHDPSELKVGEAFDLMLEKGSLQARKEKTDVSKKEGM